jgi:hypothetical protein
LIFSILVLLIGVNEFKGVEAPNNKVQEEGGVIPTVQLNLTYGGINFDRASAITAVSDGGYLVAGNTISFGAGSYDMWLVKTDSNGVHQWNQTYGGTDMDEASAIIEVSDGGYLLAGYTESFGTGQSDVWLIKTDSNGVHQWDQTYGGTDEDQAFAIIEVSDGGYLLVGRTESFGAGQSDVWLVKTDSYGVHQWNHTYGGTGIDLAFAVIELSAGGYLLAGRTESFGAGSADMWLIKTDSNGVHQWDQTYGGTRYDSARVVIEVPAGGYLLTGSTDSFGAGKFDMWLVKTDNNGVHQWNQTYGGTDMDEASAIIEVSAGGYLLAGRTNSFGAGNFDMWLVKTDNNGVHQWNQTYGGTEWDSVNDLIEDFNGDYLFVGFTGSFGEGNHDMWLVKIKGQTTSNGQITSNGQSSGFLIIPLLTVIIFISRISKRKIE